MQYLSVQYRDRDCVNSVVFANSNYYCKALITKRNNLNWALVRIIHVSISSLYNPIIMISNAFNNQWIYVIIVLSNCFNFLWRTKQILSV